MLVYQLRRLPAAEISAAKKKKEKKKRCFLKKNAYIVDDFCCCHTARTAVELVIFLIN
jgi:hypothetical protein